MLQADRGVRLPPPISTRCRCARRNSALVPLSNLVTLNEIAEAGSLQPLQPPALDHLSARLADELSPLGRNRRVEPQQTRPRACPPQVAGRANRASCDPAARC